MSDQMVAYLSNVGALSILESGFHKGHSTVTALLIITDVCVFRCVFLKFVSFTKVSVGIGFLISCWLISASHRGSFLLRSYFHFSLMISVGLSSCRITICMPMISRYMRSFF
jgi:hypothetical protein